MIACRSSKGQMVTCCSTCSFDCGPGPTQSTISCEARSELAVSSCSSAGKVAENCTRGRAGTPSPQPLATSNGAGAVSEEWSQRSALRGVVSQFMSGDGSRPWHHKLGAGSDPVETRAASAASLVAAASRGS